jgi:hypothetical protein
LNTTIDWSIIVFTDPVGSLGEYDVGATIACAAAEAANANNISALNAAVRILNFKIAPSSWKMFLALKRGTVLEQLAIVLVAIRRTALATFREPSVRHRVRQRHSTLIDRPCPAVDRRLVEYSAATSAGKGEP